jgi:hypothetical protein
MIKVDKNIKCDKYLKMKGVLKGGGGLFGPWCMCISETIPGVASELS